MTIEPTQPQSTATQKNTTRPNAMVAEVCFPEVVEMVCCSYCKRALDLSKKVQVTGKKAVVFRCNLCNCRGVQLHRIYKSWPPSGFKDLTDEDKALFWQDAGVASDRAALEKLVNERIVCKKIEEDSAKSEAITSH